MASALFPDTPYIDRSGVSVYSRAREGPNALTDALEVMTHASTRRDSSVREAIGGSASVVMATNEQQQALQRLRNRVDLDSGTRSSGPIVRVPEGAPHTAVSTPAALFSSEQKIHDLEVELGVNVVGGCVPSALEFSYLDALLDKVPQRKERSEEEVTQFQKKQAESLKELSTRLDSEISERMRQAADEDTIRRVAHRCSVIDLIGVNLQRVVAYCENLRVLSDAAESLDDKLAVIRGFDEAAATSRLTDVERLVEQCECDFDSYQSYMMQRLDEFEQQFSLP